MLRSYWFPCACPDTRVRLANLVHSLARFSKRTTEHRLPTVPTAGLHPGRFLLGLVCPVAPSPLDFRPYFTSLFEVLFSVRSRYLFAIGLKTYLVFAVDAREIHEGFPTPATRELTHNIVVYRTGLSPCFMLRSRRLLIEVLLLVVSPYTTLPEGFGLDCVVFTRRY